MESYNCIHCKNKIILTKLNVKHYEKGDGDYIPFIDMYYVLCDFCKKDNYLEMREFENISSELLSSAKNNK